MVKKLSDLWRTLTGNTDDESYGYGFRHHIHTNPTHSSNGFYPDDKNHLKYEIQYDMENVRRAQEKLSESIKPEVTIPNTITWDFTGKTYTLSVSTTSMMASSVAETQVYDGSYHDRSLATVAAKRVFADTDYRYSPNRFPQQCSECRNGVIEKEHPLGGCVFSDTDGPSYCVPCAIDIGGDPAYVDQMRDLVPDDPPRKPTPSKRRSTRSRIFR